MIHTKPKTARKTKAVTKSQPTFVGKHLVVDPRVCHGELTFRGTRVPVSALFANIEGGATVEEFTSGSREYPANK